jgi:hypothetical protein
VAKTKAYELTLHEANLIRGLRQGRLVLPPDENWLQVTEREARAILLLRRIAYGLVTLQLRDGEPVELEAGVHVRLKEQLLDEERVELIKELREV